MYHRPFEPNKPGGPAPARFGQPAWMPDWTALRAAAPEIPVDAREGYVYLIADAHLGAPGATPEAFLALLRGLPRARMVVFLGDLFQVWLALPRYWDDSARAVLEGFARLRSAGVPLVFVVGNREYFVPRKPAVARRRGLPFDHIVHEACVLTWGERRYFLTHGDLVNRGDTRYLRWRRISRTRAFEAAFRTLPGPLARGLSRRIERMLARTNREIKISYPRDELQAFAGTVLEGLDGGFIGHFHRDEIVRLPDRDAALRLVPDWYSRKAVLRISRDGTVERLPTAYMRRTPQRLARDGRR